MIYLTVDVEYETWTEHEAPRTNAWIYAYTGTGRRVKKSKTFLEYQTPYMSW